MPSVVYLCRGNDNGHTDTGAKASASSILIVGSWNRIDDKGCLHSHTMYEMARRTNEMEKRRECERMNATLVSGETTDEDDEKTVYGFGKCVRWWIDTKRKLNTVHVKVIFQPFALARIGPVPSPPHSATFPCRYSHVVFFHRISFSF